MEQTPLPPLLSDEILAHLNCRCENCVRSVAKVIEADRAKTREVVRAILAKWKTELEVDGWDDSLQYNNAVALAKSQLDISPTKP